MHPQRLEDVLPENLLQAGVAQGLDDAAEPVGIDAVGPSRARVVDQWRSESGELLVLGGFAQQGVPDAIAEPGRVRQQVADGHGRARLPQPRLARSRVEAFQHPRRELGKVRRDGRVELELAFVDELHRRDGGYRLGHRREAEHRIEAHIDAITDVSFPESALVEDAARERRHRDHAGDLPALDRASQHRVDACAYGRRVIDTCGRAGEARQSDAASCDPGPSRAHVGLLQRVAAAASRRRRRRAASCGAPYGARGCAASHSWARRLAMAV